MRILKLVLSVLLSIGSICAFASSNGDTMSTRVTTCGRDMASCTTTITDYVFQNGQWVIVSMRQIEVPNPRNPAQK